MNVRSNCYLRSTNFNKITKSFIIYFHKFNKFLSHLVVKKKKLIQGYIEMQVRFHHVKHG